MTRVRIFQSVLTGVQYVFERPITLQQFNALSEGQREMALALVKGR
jgi:hypothetical protein